ncbi:MAG TPA: FtsX-like permease family protein [Acidimicrobiia bacterium]|nr:FtsX-like permease family protein [Acidimicrobiia bacterium]
MLALSIAARFLRSSLGQTTLIVAGIAVGIAVQIFVGSLITSLQDDLVDSTVGSSAHVTLLPEEGNAVPGSLADDAAGEPEVTAAIPVRRMSAIHIDGGESTALSVTAGTASDLDSVYGLEDRIVEGSFSLEEGEILVGTGFVDGAGLGVGEALPLTLPDGSTAEYTVAGVFDLGAAAANDRLAFLDPDSAATALGLGDDEYSAIEIQVGDVFASTEVAGRLAAEGVTVVDWQDENEELLSGLAAQSGSSLMIQAFVLVAVALGIASTLAISAVQKTSQIGILKAMGMTDPAAGRIFLLQAAILGVAGVTAGIALGYLLIWGFSFAPVDFSVRPSLTLVLVSALIGIAVALLSSIIPSRSTSRLDPIEVIQGG